MYALLIALIGILGVHSKRIIKWNDGISKIACQYCCGCMCKNPSKLVRTIF